MTRLSKNKRIVAILAVMLIAIIALMAAVITCSDLESAFSEPRAAGDVTVEWELDLNSGFNTAPKSTTIRPTLGAIMPLIEGDAMPKQEGYTILSITGGRNGTGTLYYEAAVVGGNVRLESKATWTAETQTNILYVNWTANKYKVQFKGVVPTTEEQPVDINALDVTFGSSIPDTVNVPKYLRKNYVLEGFYTQPGGGGTQYYKALYDREGDVEGFVIADGISPKYYLNTNLTLYANWTPDEYKVAYFSLDDNYFPKPGSEDEPGRFVYVTEQSVKFGNFNPIGEFDVDPNLVKAGYTFIGWSLAEGVTNAWYLPGRVYPSVRGAAEGVQVELYAVWIEKENYLVTYEANGADGGLPEPSVFKAYFDQTYVVPTDKIPVRPNYTFIGWNSAPSGNGLAYPLGTVLNGSPEYKVKEELKLYAQWKLNNTVSFSANGGSFPSAMDKLYPSKGTAVKISYENNPMRTAYTFLGWSLDKTAKVPTYTEANKKDYIMGDENVVLYAIWETKTYNIDYSEDDKYYSFSEKPATYKYTENYNFTLVIDTAKVSGQNMIVSINGALIFYNEEISVGTLRKYKYEVKNAMNDQIIQVMGVTPLIFDIKYRGDGGIGDGVTEYTYGTGATLPNGTNWKKTGYIFSHWVNDANKKVTVIGDTEFGEKTFTAKWTPITYTLRFDRNGGLGGQNLSDMSMTYDVQANLKDGTAWKKNVGGTDYAFKGWSSDSKAVNIEWIKGTPVSNLSIKQGEVVMIYAIYDLPYFKITYMCNGGHSAVGGATAFERAIVAATTADIVFEGVMRTGYTFKGWSETVDATTPKYTLSGTNSIPNINANYALYAVWQANKYTILYNGNGGNRSGNTTYSTGVTYTYDVNFNLWKNDFKHSDNSQIFIGWALKDDAIVQQYNDAQRVKNITSVNNAVATLYAVWGPAGKVVLKYDTNGGTWVVDGNGNPLIQAPQEITYASDGSAGTGVRFDYIPVLENHDFIGWQHDTRVYKTEDADKMVYFLEAKDIVLYAVWELKTYQISFMANSGIGNMNPIENILYGDSKQLTVNTFTKKSHSFLGWSLDKDANVAVYLDGQVVVGLATDESVEVIGGKNFVKLYAIWLSDNPVYVMYDANGGFAAPISETFTAKEDGVISKKVPTRYGYDFKNWTYKKTIDGIEVDFAVGIGGTINIDKDTYLVAVWQERVKYYVQYSLNSGLGSVPSDGTVYYIDDYITAKFTREPYRNGYKFIGWSIDKGKTLIEKGKNETFQLTAELANELFGNSGLSDVVFEAMWLANTYEVAFNKTAGIEGSMANQTFTFDDIAKGLTLNVFIPKAGFMFVGWALTQAEADLGGVSYSNGAKVRNLAESGVFNLYAVWKPIVVTVTFDKMGGYGGTVSVDALYGAKLEIASSPTKVGYTFQGYFSQKVGGDLYYTSEMVGSLAYFDVATTLYAQWLVITYNVTFVNGKEILINYELNFEMTNFVMPTGEELKIIPPRGSRMAGWSTNNVFVEFKQGVGYNMWTTGQGNDITLRAVLTEVKTYNVTYLAEKANNTPIDVTSYVEGDEVSVIFSRIPSRKGYLFLGYKIDQTSDELTYSYDDYLQEKKKGDSADLSRFAFEINANTTLFAVFKEPVYILSQKVDDNEIIVTSDDGFHPEWRLSVKIVDNQSSAMSGNEKFDFKTVRTINRVYEIKLIDKNGNVMPLDYEVKVKMPIPTELVGTKFVMYHIASEEEMVKVDYKLSEDGKYVTFDVTSFSEFVFAEEAPSLMIPLVVVCSVGLLILIAMIFAIILLSKARERNLVNIPPEMISNGKIIMPNDKKKK